MWSLDVERAYNYVSEHKSIGYLQLKTKWAAVLLMYCQKELGTLALFLLLRWSLAEMMKPRFEQL